MGTECLGYMRPDVTNQIICAEAFLMGYKRCNPEEEFDDSTKLGLPAIVCGAFAVEVAMKALLELHGKPSKGHDLIKLYNKLPAHLQMQIRDGTCLSENDFLHELANAKSAFEDWRYFYEDKNFLIVNVDFLGKIAAVTIAIAERVASEA